MRSLFAAALLTACQGGSGASDPPRPPVANPPALPMAPPAGPTTTSETPIAATNSATPSSAADAATTVTGLRAAAPAVGSEHRLTGFVVKRYVCPPCPPDAQCKPCMESNIVLSDDVTLHEQYDLDDRDVIVFTKDPMTFTLGAKVTVRVRVLDRRHSNRGINDLEFLP